MKKTYQKPEVRVIEFSLMEAIAATSCVAQVYNHADGTSCKLLPPFDMPGIEFNFGTGEVECTAPIEGYCYFTSTETAVFAS